MEKPQPSCNRSRGCAILNPFFGNDAREPEARAFDVSSCRRSVSECDERLVHWRQNEIMRGAPGFLVGINLLIFHDKG
jgi:hypothetical protein